MTIDYVEEARQLFAYTQDLRRDLHIHPELAFNEFRTAGVVARELSALELDVTTGIAETGVVALLEGGRPGPVILLRFDMDALPIQEDTGKPYSSQTPGVMHACGHDGHTAIGLTVASLLHRYREQLAGTVKFVFQPAEEIAQGAKKMVDEGVLRNPRPDISISVHLWNSKPVGWFGLTPGPAMAAADKFRIRIEGVGGHAARPQATIDPVLTASNVVQSLQTIISRNLPPLDSAVLSVTTIHGGNAFNVIPATVELEGMIRTYREEVRSLVLKRMSQIVEGTSAAMGCEGEIEFMEGTPSLVNDPDLTGQVQAIVRDILPYAVISQEERVMGSEDMAYLMREIPGCYIMVGSANEEKGLNASHHHPRFDFDEDSLTLAVAVIGTVVDRLLS